MTEPQIRLQLGTAAWQEAADVTLLLDLKDEHYYVVNDAGTVLWHMLSEGTTADDMTRRLKDLYAIDAERARADVDAFVGQCRSRGYLES